jgi:hypothetical protein
VSKPARHGLSRVPGTHKFGPLSIRPCHGSTWAQESKPIRLPATYHRTHGVRYFHGCYSLGEDQLWGVNRRRKGGDHSLAAIKSIRAARPDGAPIYVIMDNLSANKTPAVRAWASRHNVELCLTRHPYPHPHVAAGQRPLIATLPGPCPTGEGKLSCAAVMDAYSRRIIGWSIAHHMRTELVLDSLGMAILRRRPEGGDTILHSDHGTRYVL